MSNTAQSQRSAPGSAQELLSRYASGNRDFKGALLRHADLREAMLEGADLSAADLEGADLSGARLDGADLSAAALAHARLTHARMRAVRLQGARLLGADLSHADLTEADLRDAFLDSVDLAGAELYLADLRGADLGMARLKNAKLWGARLKGAILERTDLSGADLRASTGAQLDTSYTKGATFSLDATHAWPALVRTYKSVSLVFHYLAVLVFVLASSVMQHLLLQASTPPVLRFRLVSVALVIYLLSVATLGYLTGHVTALRNIEDITGYSPGWKEYRHLVWLDRHLMPAATSLGLAALIIISMAMAVIL